jgi:hypothetical protein
MLVTEQVMCFFSVSVYIRVLRSFGYITNISSEMLLVTSGKVTDNISIDIERYCRYCKQFILRTLS